jgi:hypothetical protein
MEQSPSREVNNPQIVNNFPPFMETKVPYPFQKRPLLERYLCQINSLNINAINIYDLYTFYVIISPRGGGGGLYSPWRTLAASHIGGFLSYLDIW